MDSEPTLQEVLLRKATSIGADDPSLSVAQMPLNPGSVASILRAVGKPTTLKRFAPDAESVAKDGLRKLQDYKNNDLVRNFIYNTLGYGYKKGVAPFLHDIGLPAYPNEAIQKPWLSHQFKYFTGVPDSENPNPMIKP